MRFEQHVSRLHLAIEIGLEERREQSLDDGLEDRTYPDEIRQEDGTPFDYPVSQVVDDLMAKQVADAARIASLTSEKWFVEMQLAAAEERISSLEAALAAPLSEEGT